MNKSSNSLLALLLTLPDIESPLTVGERESLQNVGDMLCEYPEVWESEIEPDLLKIVHANQTWSQLFTATKAKLDGLDDKILQKQLPSPEEVDRAFSSEEKVVTRGEIPEDDDDDIAYLKNISVPILSESDPQSASQKVIFFDRLKEFLSNSTPSS